MQLIATQSKYNNLNRISESEVLDLISSADEVENTLRNSYDAESKMEKAIKNLSASFGIVLTENVLIKIRKVDVDFFNLRLVLKEMETKEKEMKNYLNRFDISNKNIKLFLESETEFEFDEEFRKNDDDKTLENYLKFLDVELQNIENESLI